MAGDVQWSDLTDKQIQTITDPIKLDFQRTLSDFNQKMEEILQDQDDD